MPDLLLGLGIISKPGRHIVGVLADEMPSLYVIQDLGVESSARILANEVKNTWLNSKLLGSGDKAESLSHRNIPHVHVSSLRHAERSTSGALA